MNITNNGYVIDEKSPLGSFPGEDMFESLEEAQNHVAAHLEDLRTSPEIYEPGHHSFLIKEARKLEDGTIERLETASRHLAVLGPRSGAQ